MLCNEINIINYYLNMYSIDSIFQFYHIAEFVKSICQAIGNLELSDNNQTIFLYTVINPLQTSITSF
jgi:hypothetical protein